MYVSLCLSVSLSVYHTHTRMHAHTHTHTYTHKTTHVVWHCSCTEYQGSDEELTTELYCQDSSYGNSDMITDGMTPDISTPGQAAMSQTDQPAFTMATESSQDSRQSQSQSAGRFVLESDHLALKNNSECVYVILLLRFSYVLRNLFTNLQI